MADDGPDLCDLHENRIFEILYSNLLTDEQLEGLSEKYPEINEKPFQRLYRRILTIRRLDKALSDINRAISITPNSAEAFSNRGVVWHAKGEINKALADYNTATSFNPQYPEAYYNRGLVLAEHGQHEEAIIDYTKAIKLNPRHTKAYFHRGNAWFATGHYYKAISIALRKSRDLRCYCLSQTKGRL